MNSIIRLIKVMVTKQNYLILPSGNKFFYTRNGFGIEQTKENKKNWLLNFAIKDQKIKFRVK